MEIIADARAANSNNRLSTLTYGLAVATLLSVSMGAIAADNISSVIGSYGGVWNSQSGTIADGPNGLLAFVVPGGTYSTGVNDALLTPTFIPAKFRAFKPDPEEIPLIGGLNAIARSATYSPEKSRADYLSGGTNGLDLNTALFNIPRSELQFFAAVTNASAITDTVPDVLVTQVGQPSTTAFDEFYFTDSAGLIVGNAVQVVFGGSSQVPSVGKQNWQFWSPNHTSQSNLDGDRDLRMRAYHLSDFGVTQANMGQITKFVQRLSGESDLAFVAYNEDAVEVPAVLTIKKDNGLTQLQEGKTGIVYQVTISNAGGTTASNVSWSDSAQGLLVTGIAPITQLAPGSSDNTGNCTISGCSGITLSPGSSFMYEVTTNVTGPADTHAINTAALDGGGCENGVAIQPGAECSSTDEDLIVPPTPSITVTKDNQLTEVLKDSTVLYTVVITNNSDTEASPLSWVDAASGLTVLSIAPLSQSAGSDSGTCTNTGCTGISLPAGSSIRYGVLAQVTAEAGASVRNEAVVDGGECANGTSTNPNAICRAEDEDPVVAPALEITKISNFTAAKPGDTIHYAVHIENTGTGIASNVSWTEQPDNMAILSIDLLSASNGSSAGFCSVDGCQNITVAKDGGTLTYDVTAKVNVDAVDNLVNTVALSGNGCTPDDCTSTVIDPITPLPPPLSPTPVPVDSRAMLALLVFALMAGVWRDRVRSKQQ